MTVTRRERSSGLNRALGCNRTSGIRSALLPRILAHDLATQTTARRSATQPATHPVFSPGDVLAGRYVIIRLIAHGGMGEVYEVHDLELRARVALKTIRAGPASDHSDQTSAPSSAALRGSAKPNLAIERFRRELYLARLVTHPNVCRLFDLGHQDDAPFITRRRRSSTGRADAACASGTVGA